MAKVNTSANPTYYGEITHASGAKSGVSNNMEHEVRSVLRNKVKNFGYLKETAQMFKFNVDTNDYEFDQDATNRLWATPKKGEKAPVEKIAPNESHFDGANALATLWQTEARSLKKNPAIAGDHMIELFQQTLGQFESMGLTVREMRDVVTSMWKQAEAERKQAEDAKVYSTK